MKILNPHARHAIKAAAGKESSEKAVLSNGVPATSILTSVTLGCSKSLVDITSVEGTFPTVGGSSTLVVGFAHWPIMWNLREQQKI
ncbi:unnamed protein product [Allacma fusca]|uniref:Uncharacterized protein n=1 Tax=Allacma fusca TaxID=39272 RepID=A0A8J2PC03_9HEXA|nr:unnamed protein product [Allacma fusca]